VRRTRPWARWKLRDFDKGIKWHVPESSRLWQDCAAEEPPTSSGLEENQVLGDWFSAGSGCKVGNSNAIGNNALVGSDPRVQFTGRLLEVNFNVRVDNVLILTENFVTKTVERSEGSLGLLMASLEFFFGRASISVFISSCPEVRNADP
jgi:hypothetical protein